MFINSESLKENSMSLAHWLIVLGLLLDGGLYLVQGRGSMLQFENQLLNPVIVAVSGILVVVGLVSLHASLWFTLLILGLYVVATFLAHPDWNALLPTGRRSASSTPSYDATNDYDDDR
jgi:hypothetical protein